MEKKRRVKGHLQSPGGVFSNVVAFIQPYFSNSVKFLTVQINFIAI